MQGYQNQHAFPETNEFRIIIPSKGFIPYYDLRKFHPTQLDNRVSRELIECVIEEICAPLKSCKGITIKLLICLSGPILVSIVLIILTIHGSKLFVWKYIFLVAAVLLCVLIIILSLRSFRIKETDVIKVINQYQDQFQKKGLKWVIPSHCLWLELWKNYNTTNNNLDMNSFISADLEVEKIASEKDLYKIELQTTISNS